MCLACLVQPFSRLLALMWFARRVLIKFSGSTPVTQQKVLPPRRATDRHHAISTSATVTPYGVPMAALLYMMVEHRRIRVWRRPAMELIHLFDTCRERVQYLNKLNIGPPKV